MYALAVKIKPDFKPLTNLALQWAQTSDGNWFATDREVTADKYDAEIRIYGIESIINNFIDFLEINRSDVLTNINNKIFLSNFNSQEHIFGADLNYSGNINATAFIDKREQRTWKGFGLPLKLNSIAPITFTGGTGALPQLRFLNYGYEGDAEYTINKLESYKGDFYFADHQSDAGIFNGVFTFTDEEMIQLRRFLATIRGAAFAYPVFIGVSKPFGRRTPVSPSGRYVKIIDFEDTGMTGLIIGRPRWIARLKFSLVE